jgi:membrane peptidoglycan carboxypeptidase
MPLSSNHPSLLVNRRLKRAERRQHSPRAVLVRFAAGCTAALGLLLVLAVFVTGAVYADLTAHLPPIDALPALLSPQGGLLLEPTRIYDRTGQHLLYTLENPGIQRRYLRVDPNQTDHISPFLIQVTLDLVDPTFWSSPGFDWKHLTASQPATLAERLVNDLLVANEPAGLRRTLRMRLLAAQITHIYGRTQVLEWYLNSAYYGHLTYGIDSAAQLYLGKSANELTLEEAALLVPVVDAPALNPIDSPAAALEREQAALATLLGRGVISAADYQAKTQIRIALKTAPVSTEEISSAFDQLVTDRLAERYGRRNVERGGLKIVTSLDYNLQIQLNCTLRTQLMRLEGQPSAVAGTSCDAARLLPTLPPDTATYPAGLTASGVLLDLQTGQVLALAGDTTTAGEKSLLSGHTPGSLLSPFVALAGFARSRTPADLVWDIPSSLPTDLAGKTNPDQKFHGPVRLRMAVANDYLVPLSQLLEQIGTNNIQLLAAQLGLNLQNVEAGDSKLLFEGGRVNPLDMANAYATFANLGSQKGELNSIDNSIDPILVLQVERQGEGVVAQSGDPVIRPVVSTQLAYLVHNVLSDASARWPSLGYPNALEIGRPVGAKIGQVSSGSGTGNDVWTVGYTPQRLAVIWVGQPAAGSDEKATPLDPEMAAGIWHAVMKTTVQSLPGLDWSVPEGITQQTVCDPSGKLPTADCPATVEEVFTAGSEPGEYDDLYKAVEINRETGLLATVFTPLQLVEEKTYLVYPSNAEDWARTAGLTLPPTDYDTIQLPEGITGAQITAPVSFGYVRGKVDIRGQARGRGQAGAPSQAGGDGFRSYRLQVGAGLNPRTWLLIGNDVTTPVENGLLGTWDTTAQPDGLYAMRLIVLREDQQFDSTILQVTVDNTPPQAAVTYPTAGQAIAAGERLVNFQAAASDAVGLDRVEWVLDAKVLAGSNAADALTGGQGSTFSQPWTAVKGQHTLLLRAYDLAGNSSESEAVEFTVQ